MKPKGKEQRGVEWLRNNNPSAFSNKYENIESIEPNKKFLIICE